MILHVLDRAREADIGPVAVACADPEIADAVRAAGGTAVMTDPIPARPAPTASTPPSPRSTPRAATTWSSTCKATCRPCPHSSSAP